MSHSLLNAKPRETEIPVDSWPSLKKFCTMFNFHRDMLEEDFLQAVQHAQIMTMQYDLPPLDNNSKGALCIHPSLVFHAKQYLDTYGYTVVPSANRHERRRLEADRREALRLYKDLRTEKKLE